MVVQHNLTAMNSNRMLGLTTKTQAKSTEKLSSGYKINRAADDAAGLAISEKMRKQIRGLTQASANAQDGISAVQTAEGALTEVHDMLQRMNELAVKASNETNSASDRDYIQSEIDQLVTEIDRVSQTTKFNETYLLQGDAAGSVTANSTKSLASAKTATTEGTMQASGIKVELAEGSELTAGSLKVATVTAKANKGTLDLSNLSGELKTELDKAGATDAAADLTLTYAAGADGAPDKWQIGSGGSYTAAQLKEMGLNVTGVTENVTINKTVEVSDGTPAGVKVTAQEGDLALAKVAIGQEVNVTLTATRNATTNANEISVEDYSATYVPSELKLDLQVGADTSASNKIELSITSMSAISLGLVGTDGRLHVDGDDSTNADKAVNTIADAIKKVSTQRATLGAVQNRLEHTINNLDNVVENTTSAESAIRDTDMASEMVKYSNNNILAQAGQAMLAQANQSNQGVLSLLG